MPNSMGKRIRMLRIKRGWLQKELASKTGFTAQKISNIERGFTTEVSSEDVGIFSRALEVSADFILDITPEMKIKEAIKDDEELLIFFDELSKREDLKLLFRQVKPLKDETIKRIIRYIKIVEDEEALE